MAEKTLIVITGPTASGKSALAVQLAKALSTEIISADSRQIYRDIPVVTARPTEQEMEGIPHHLMGFLPLDSYYSASLFERDALAVMARIFEKTDYAIVCGGSMLYLDALCYGIDDIPTVPESLRHSLAALHRARGDSWLLGRLELVDPATASRIDRNNVKRIFHALEVSLAAGRPYSSLLTGTRKERPFRILRVVLEAERDILFGRINSRVDEMMGNGLLEEARRVYPMRGLNSLNTVGLKELFTFFDGDMSLPEAVARIAKNTRVYAKKQLTWLARDRSRPDPLPSLSLPVGDDANVARIIREL